jgi:hypothetical protein
MKKSIVQVLLLFIPFFVQSQSYHPLLIQGNRWNNQYIPHQSQYKCGKIYISDSTGTEILTLSEDTAIRNGNTYWNLVASYGSINDPGRPLGLIREDTSSGKVYFIGQSELFFPFEMMLYDFSVKAKDTIWFHKDQYYEISDIVDTVDSIKIVTELRKRIRLSRGNIWIEGIGALDGLVSASMEMWLCGTNYTRTLLCFYNNDSLVYQPENSEYKNCFYPTVSIASIMLKQEFSLNPNPAEDFFTITSNSDENHFVEIADIQGQIAIRKMKFGLTGQINLQGIKSGLYFVRITSRQNIFTYKLIKD